MTRRSPSRSSRRRPPGSARTARPRRRSPTRGGFDHDIDFTPDHAARLRAWVTVTVDSDLYAGDDAVKAAIKAIADDFGPAMTCSGRARSAPRIPSLAFSRSRHTDEHDGNRERIAG